jgi:hypothetical protein
MYRLYVYRYVCVRVYQQKVKRYYAKEHLLHQ